MNDFFLAIISTKRSKNVAFMQELCNPYKCNWFVNEDDYGNYFNAGAHGIYATDTHNICQARNKALAYAVGLPCIQISDDLRSIKHISLDSAGKRQTKFINVEQTIKLLIEQCKNHSAFFGGVAINNNPLNYTGQDVSTDKLIVNDFICMMPGCIPFDETLALKEDYDMCVEQLIRGNKIVRLNNILCDFPHRQNEGGANTYRNDETENAATRTLMAKWPKYIIPHRTRPGQVSLDYKAIERRIKGAESNTLFD